MNALMNFLKMALLTLWACAAMAAPNTVRVGVLEFGTVNWELEALRILGLDKQHGIDLVVVPLASGDASTVALQGGAVDVIVSDWLWVSRQRAQGKPYTFVTYSNAVGSVVVPANSGIRSVADLKGKKIGISGGPYDKIWTLLRAHALRNHHLDLTQAATLRFGAPPLLNELIVRGELDAVLNTWPFAARLQAQGMRSVIGLGDVLKGLGIAQSIPLIGWVFREDWAAQNPALVNQFLAASHATKQALQTQDSLWQSLRTRMRARDDDALFTQLRDGFRAGMPHCLDDATRQTIAQTYAVLASVGGEPLVGSARTLSPGTFWAGQSPSTCTPRTP
ncbi:MAG: ABC transporter substrate-binding protein [Rhodoferax sp.]